MHKSTESIMEGIGPLDGRSALDDAIARAAVELDRTEEAMERQAERIIRDINSMRADLAAGQHISASGVLQRHGVELDLLAARRAQVIETLKSFVYVKKNI